MSNLRGQADSLGPFVQWCAAPYNHPVMGTVHYVLCLDQVRFPRQYKIQFYLKYFYNLWSRDTVCFQKVYIN